MSLTLPTQAGFSRCPMLVAIKAHNQRETNLNEERKTYRKPMTLKAV